MIFLLVGLVIVKAEYKQKVWCGYNFTPGDLEATPEKIRLMTAISFFGALVAAFTGVGPGFVFCSALIMIDIEVQVATATGMYLTMFTCLSATI